MSEPNTSAPRQGCEESSTPFQGADSKVVDVAQGRKKRAYPWLISSHASGVLGRDAAVRIQTDFLNQFHFDTANAALDADADCCAALAAMCVVAAVALE